jgi:solute carrier family 13 (sodium-dependent dicarboxylate transporter), member 2/3/5
VLPRQWRWPKELRGSFEHSYLLDTRHAASVLLGPIKRSVPAALLKVCVGVALAALIAFVPEHAGLSVGGQRTLFTLILASWLWLTEAIPSFAVGVLVIALNVALLGSPRGDWAAGNVDAWVEFVAPWGSPLLWLFFGGFVLSAAASKTGLDRRFAGLVLTRFGDQPNAILAGVMLITFITSMFMSNTATAAMMLAMIAPLLQRYREDGFSKALVIGTALAANIGGMGTIIGTPPNAIAAGALMATKPIGFAEWMFVGLPPAMLLGVLGWIYLVKAHPSTLKRVLFNFDHDEDDDPQDEIMPWQRTVAMLTILGTIIMWLTSSLHGIPNAVVAVMPIAILTVTGILDERDIRGLSWDVLLLLAGGLSLGVAVAKTGVADWLILQLPISGLALLPLGVALAYLTSLLSNVMSNTATANILIPLAIALSQGQAAALVVPLALAASSAMCMPISTPPNAIAFGTGLITTRQLAKAGLIIGLLSPLLVVLWSRFALLVLGQIKI